MQLIASVAMVSVDMASVRLYNHDVCSILECVPFDARQSHGLNALGYNRGVHRWGEREGEDASSSQRGWTPLGYNATLTRLKD